MIGPLLKLAGTALATGAASKLGEKAVEGAFDQTEKAAPKTRAEMESYLNRPLTAVELDLYRNLEQQRTEAKREKDKTGMAQNYQQRGFDPSNSFTSGIDGNIVGSTFNADPVMRGLDDPRLMQNPGDLSSLQQQIQRDQMAYENQMGRGNTAYNAGIANAGANSTMRRAMARDAQTQRAEIAKGMMNNVSNSFGNTLQQSTNGMANVLAAFR